MAYDAPMVFIETPTFTRQIVALISDAEYRKLQQALADNPEMGDLLQGGGGIRKLRWAVAGTGKSGGIRSIYFWKKSADQIFMLLAYPKSAKDTLTDQETAILRKLVKEL